MSGESLLVIRGSIGPVDLTPGPCNSEVNYWKIVVRPTEIAITLCREGRTSDDGEDSPIVLTVPWSKPRLWRSEAVGLVPETLQGQSGFRASALLFAVVLDAISITCKDLSNRRCITVRAGLNRSATSCGSLSWHQP
jgi:hypothetical protein